MENVTQEAKNMELKVIENIQRFAWNFNDVKAALQERIEKYTDLVVTDDNVKDMEKTQREIASLRVKMETFRKKVKNDLDNPYRTFDLQMMDLKKIIAEAEDPIKDQLDKYERRRIESAKEELLKYAAETAQGIGLREENAHITILAKWTNRTAKKNQTRQEICAELDRLLVDQTNQDDAELLAAQKADLIAQLCESTSELYSLATPVTPLNVAHLTQGAGIADLAGVIKGHCHNRAEIERQAAEQARQLEEAKAAAEVRRQEAAEEAKRKAAEQALVRDEPQTKQAHPAAARVPAKYDLTLSFANLTVAQAQELCAYIKSVGITFEVISKERVA